MRPHVTESPFALTHNLRLGVASGGSGNSLWVIDLSSKSTLPVGYPWGRCYKHVFKAQA